jgi:archaellin
MSERNQIVERNREEGSIGIGAMIVFIALILVAAVASTIIIKTAEELQQNAEQTSSDTRKEISGKINIVNAMVNRSGLDTDANVDSIVFTAKVAAGAVNLQVQNIDWLLTCGDSDGNYGFVGGNLGTTDDEGTVLPDPLVGGGKTVNADKMDSSDYGATEELSAGTIFKFDLTLDGGQCDTLAEVGDDLLLKVIVIDGGTTLTELSIDSITAGSAVV